MDMGALLGSTMWPGDASGWPGGNAQASVPVTNLSPHVDGGAHSAGQANAHPSGSQTLRYSAVIVLSAIALLWLSGTLLFKSASL